jgi:hypothetical protein
LSRPLAVTLQNAVIEKVLRFEFEEQMAARKEELPFVKINVYKADKRARINRIVPSVEAGRMKLRRGMYDLENELVYGEKEGHDDITDPLSDVVEVENFPAGDNAAEKKAPVEPVFVGYRDVAAALAARDLQTRERRALAKASQAGWEDNGVMVGEFQEQ